MNLICFFAQLNFLFESPNLAIWSWNELSVDFLEVLMATRNPATSSPVDMVNFPVIYDRFLNVLRCGVSRRISSSLLVNCQAIRALRLVKRYVRPCIRMPRSQVWWMRSKSISSVFFVWNQVGWTFRTLTRWWQLKYFLCSPRSLGRWSNLTNIFQRGWNSTTN